MVLVPSILLGRTERKSGGLNNSAETLALSLVTEGVFEKFLCCVIHNKHILFFTFLPFGIYKMSLLSLKRLYTCNSMRLWLWVVSPNVLTFL